MSSCTNVYKNDNKYLYRNNYNMKTSFCELFMNPKKNDQNLLDYASNLHTRNTYMIIIIM